MGFSAQDAVMPGELTPDAQKQLEEMLTVAFKQYNLSGGPGFTRETAWVLSKGVEPQTILNSLPDCMKQDSALMTASNSINSGTFYVCDVVAEWEGKSYKLELYFKTSTPENEK